MGGRGGGLPPSAIKDTWSLVSERERNQTEVDQVLTVGRAISEDFGENVTDWRVAKLDAKHGNTIAFCSAIGDDNEIAINENYFDAKAMDTAYDGSVKSGYHPSRGRKSGTEAVVYHETGHMLVNRAAYREGTRSVLLAKSIVSDAQKSLGIRRWDDLASRISGYARDSYHETIAESLSDVYCNGAKAKRESRAVVSSLLQHYPNANARKILGSTSYLGGSWE